MAKLCLELVFGFDATIIHLVLGGCCSSRFLTAAVVQRSGANQ